MIKSHCLTHFFLWANVPIDSYKTSGFLVLSVGIKWENKLLVSRDCLIFHSKINPL